MTQQKHTFMVTEKKAYWKELIGNQKSFRDKQAQ